jgi:hypothetical protein
VEDCSSLVVGGDGGLVVRMFEVVEVFENWEDT